MATFDPDGRGHHILHLLAGGQMSRNSPDDDCVDVPVADLRLALDDRARLLSEHEKSKEAVEALREQNRLLADAVRWRQVQITRGVLNMTDGELTEARFAQEQAIATLTTQEETKP